MEKTKTQGEEEILPKQAMGAFYFTKLYELITDNNLRSIVNAITLEQKISPWDNSPTISSFLPVLNDKILEYRERQDGCLN
jgi:hypothetical protein